MKISQKLAAAEAEGRTSWSFEYFPPKTDNGFSNLYDRIERMSELGPIFIDITWGAGGTTSNLTTDFVKMAHQNFGLETCMHLTCTNMPKEKIDNALKQAYKFGCENILALRGDPPKGTDEWTATDGGFEHAIDLIKHIRLSYGDHFDIAVAGFPEGHPNSILSKDQETVYLREKIDAGANFIFTQMFYDVEIFIDWVRRIRAAGITVPVIPGIMPIQSWAQFKRITNFSKTIIPQHFLDQLEPIQSDDEAVRKVGTKLISDMCRRILDSDLGIKILHFYTMNLERGTKMILDELKLTPSRDITNPLPWKLSLSGKRRTETIRPIFWANRTKSYLSRTEAWDEFPNGRWGDSRSPAYGEVDGYGININPVTVELLKELKLKPKSDIDLSTIFAAYCAGKTLINGEKIKYLPWSDIPLSKETSKIQKILFDINRRGFLTVNSQPAVDGAKSSDPVHGWGPRGGYVYQKAYVEFFCRPDKIKSLTRKLENDPDATYYAITRTGDIITNNTNPGPNAVTWGVFPGKEIIQPTIVELVSFIAWKDEAFELGLQWAELYKRTEPKSYEFLREVMNSWYLVNIVNNDFRKTNDYGPNNSLYKFFEDEALLVDEDRFETQGDEINRNINGNYGNGKTYDLIDKNCPVKNIQNGLTKIAI
ncbi:methylenetetrahydrofolate reductase [Phakopsora pachyrhizi]|nr:methylenetetrahydrofolate reductase [Phakopsora pachyrhizi]